jgi:hypothetical protein
MNAPQSGLIAMRAMYDFFTYSLQPIFISIKMVVIKYENQKDKNYFLKNSLPTNRKKWQIVCIN